MTVSRRRFLGSCLLTTAATSFAVAHDGDVTPKELFKILCLDGGGVRGYLSAGILANIEAYLDKTTVHPLPLGQRFDLSVIPVAPKFPQRRQWLA